MFFVVFPLYLVQKARNSDNCVYGVALVVAIVFGEADSFVIVVLLKLHGAAAHIFVAQHFVDVVVLVIGVENVEDIEDDAVVALHLLNGAAYYISLALLE